MSACKQKKAAEYLCANKEEEGRPSLKRQGHDDDDVPEFKHLGLTIQVC